MRGNPGQPVLTTALHRHSGHCSALTAPFPMASVFKASCNRQPELGWASAPCQDATGYLPPMSGLLAFGTGSCPKNTGFPRGPCRRECQTDKLLSYRRTRHLPPELVHRHPFFSHLSRRGRGNGHEMMEQRAVSPGLSVPRPPLPSPFCRHGKAGATGDLQQGKLRQGLGRAPMAWADCDPDLYVHLSAWLPWRWRQRGLEKSLRGFGRSHVQHH